MHIGHHRRPQRVGWTEMTMSQYHPRQQLDLLALEGGGNRAKQINRALSTEVVNLLKRLIGECVAHVAIEKGGSNEQNRG
jgi:hypothetical protein